MDNKLQARKLTGNFEMGLGKNQEQKNNAEVEGGEYIKDNQGQVREVIGKRHSQGGVKVLLEDGERILTDYDTISEKLAEKIQTNLGIRVSKRDTYSTIIDKYNKKIGLKEIIEKEEGLNTKILDQKDPRIDSTTRQLNLQALSKNLEDLKTEKAPLLRKQTELFDILYAEQEKAKMFENLKEQYFQKGGQKRNFYSVIEPEWYRPDSEWTHQSANNRGAFGENMTGREGDMLGHVRDNMPGLYGDIEKSGINRDSSLRFQNSYNKNLIGEALSDVENMYGKDSDEYKEFSTKANSYLFSDDGSVNSLDGKFGNRTSSRAAFALNIIPRDTLMELKNEGINTLGQLKGNEKYADIYDKYGKGKSDHWNLGPLEEVSAIDGLQMKGLQGNDGIKTAEIPNLFMDPNKVKPKEKTVKGKEDKVKKELKDGDPFTNLLTLFPDSGIRKPGGVLPHLKTQNYLQQSYTPEVTANEGLRELNRSRMNTQSSFRDLDPQSRALAALGMNSQVNDSIVKLHSNVADANSKIRNANANQNIGLRDQFQQRQNASAMDYEQKTYKAMDNNEQNWRRYYADIARDQRSKWNSINKLNANNALNPDVQYVNGQYKVRKGYIDDTMFRNFLQTDEGKALLESMQKTKSKKKTR